MVQTTHGDENDPDSGIEKTSLIPVPQPISIFYQSAFMHIRNAVDSSALINRGTGETARDWKCCEWLVGLVGPELWRREGTAKT